MTGSALASAVEEGRTEAVRALLVKEADPNSANNDGDTVLCIAASKDFVEIAKLLIEKGAKPDLIGTPRPYGNAHFGGLAPLHVAAWEGQAAIAKLLLEAGAQVDLKANILDRTALHLAAEQGHMDLVELLIDNRASIDPVDKVGFTPLLHACAPSGGADNSAIVRLLLARGADPNVKSADGNSPLMYAAYRGLTETVAALLSQGANPNILNRNTAGGQTALTVAAEQGHASVVDQLLKAGADVNSTNSNGMTALIWGAANCHVDVVDHLLTAGADPNARCSVIADDLGGTAYRTAIDYANEHLETSRYASKGQDLEESRRNCAATIARIRAVAGR